MLAQGPGEESEAPRRRWKPGQERHPGPKNQDSQHTLNQPRGSCLNFVCIMADVSDYIFRLFGDGDREEELSIHFYNGNERLQTSPENPKQSRIGPKRAHPAKIQQNDRHGQPSKSESSKGGWKFKGGESIP